MSSLLLSRLLRCFPLRQPPQGRRHGAAAGSTAVHAQSFHRSCAKPVAERGASKRCHLGESARGHRRYGSCLVPHSCAWRSEGFSDTTIEAVASSLPVGAADAGGNAEAVK